MARALRVALAVVRMVLLGAGVVLVEALALPLGATGCDADGEAAGLSEGDGLGVSDTSTGAPEHVETRSALLKGDRGEAIY